MQITTVRPRITATTDGDGAVSHAGSRLLADGADRPTLTRELSEALAVLRRPRARLDPGGCWSTWRSRLPMASLAPVPTCDGQVVPSPRA